jgi:hypothetical protein
MGLFFYVVNIAILKFVQMLQKLNISSQKSVTSPVNQSINVPFTPSVALRKLFSKDGS